MLMGEVSREAIKEFYEKNDVILPDSSGFRQYRFIDCITLNNKKKRAHIVQETIKTPKDLKRHLLRYLPRNVFYSTSLWLCPRNVRAIGQGSFSDNVYLGSDLVFDFDSEDIDQAFSEAISLYSELKKKYEPKYTSASGGKGYHLVFNYTSKGSEDKDKVAKKKIFERYTDNMKTVDPSITFDTRRILRVLNSLHPSGRRCMKVKFPHNNNSSRVSKDSPARTCYESEVAPAKRGAINPRTVSSRREPRALLPTYSKIPQHHNIVITSSIKGTKGNQVVVYRLKEQNDDFMKQLQKKYDLGTLHHITDGLFHYYVSLKAMHPQKLKKVYKKVNRVLFNRYNFMIFPMIFKYLGSLEAECEGTLSSPHAVFFKSRLAKGSGPLSQTPFNTSIGKPQLQVMKLLHRE